MSKPYVQAVTSQATVARRGPLLKYMLRMGLYWLCATMLLWSGTHPLSDWHLSTVVGFYLSSTLVMPVMGYASFWLREHDGHEVAVGDKISQSLSATVTQAGLLVLELFIVLMTVVTVERLLF